MRVTFVLAGPNLAGGDRVIITLAERLRRRGHEVLVAWPQGARPSIRAHLAALRKGSLAKRPTHDLTYFMPPEVQVARRAVPGASVRTRDIPDADVVVATFWLTAEWVEKLAPSKGRPMYFIQQYESNFGHPRERIDATWHLPMPKIVCSSWLADLARDRFADPTAVVVPNGVDLLLFYAPVRAKQPYPTVGFLYAPGNAVKQTSTALEILDAVRRRLPELRALSFGTDGLSSASSLPSYISYTCKPPQTSLRDIYARCDVWLCTSSSEGFHLPPHEAMACRTPVVSTRVGGPTDLVQQGVNGYLCDVGDIQGLINHLIDILNLDDSRWRSMSDAAYRTATRYTWDDATDLFERAMLRAAGHHVPEIRTTV